jgi:guanylate kinase
LRTLVLQAGPLVPQLVEQQRTRFLERWKEAMGLTEGTGGTLPEAAQDRALTEATAFAIRIDVAEELTRLNSHLDEIERLLKKGGEIGKRLDFLIQELHREANTLGSKSAALELTRIGGHEGADRADARTGAEHRMTSERMDYPGNIFVVAAPSGAGKSSLVKALMELDSAVQPSVSHTTRSPRGQEKHGREYFFASPSEFDALIAADGFVEWANVHGHRYGTSKRAVEERIAQGADVILEIDFQGALQIRKTFANAVMIFILPPSWEELRSRLERRGEDSASVIELR